MKLSVFEDAKRYPVQILWDFSLQLFLKVGLPEDQARIVTDSLIDANMRGIDTHGVTRLISIYIERLRAGALNIQPNVRIIQESPSTAVIDGDNGLGAVVSTIAMQHCIRKAKEAGAAWVGVCHSNHFGTCGYWTMMAAREDMIGFGMTNSPPTMAPWGAASRYLSTNPISISAPTGGPWPVVFDIASSVVARGNIILAAKLGGEIPEGWALDTKGRPTTDPQEALAGTVTPVGGHKGSGLSMMIDVLCGVLTGATFGSRVGGLYGTFKPQNLGHFFGAIDIGQFIPIEQFKSRIDQMIREIKSCELAEWADKIYVPGEIEAEEMTKREKEGIPLPQNVIEELENIGKELGVPFPA